MTAHRGRFAIRSTRVLTDAGLRPAAIVVDGERIEAVIDHGAVPPGLPVEEMGELVVAPGLVDTHVHVNEPGRTDWEGFDTATRAAAAGGVTTVVDMPLNCIPVTTTRGALERKRAALPGKLHVDVGLWGGVVPDNRAELDALVEGGVLGCKAFLCHSGIDDFPETRAEELHRAMEALAPAGVPLLAHAELPGPGAEAEPSGDRRSHDTWLRSRPPEWEEAAIALLVRLCRETGCAVHVVHLSAATAVPMLREARAEGLPITVETCPHYLCLSAEEIPDGGTSFKCAPPIRGAANREALWAALDEGVIDHVVTDHSPCEPSLKHPDTGDFVAAWGGVSSLSLGLASVWTEARRRGVSLERVLRWMTAGPARVAGLGARKGRLAPGLDADVVAIDPDDAFVVSRDGLPFRHGVSPYVGRELSGTVRRTWLRGTLVRADASSRAEPSGRPLGGRDPAGDAA